MRIPEEVLQEIRTRISIVDEVGRHVALKRAGKNWKGLCPFHREKTPSFVVNEERRAYHCFGCGAGGTVFRFLMEVEGRTFGEVACDLASRAGVHLELGPESPVRRREREETEAIRELLELAARYYRYQLKEGRAGETARAYLTKRGIPPDTADAFSLGCAPSGWDHLARYLKKKGKDLRLAAVAGLVMERTSGGYYDRLRDRLVFPIVDPAGRVVSFGGRTLGDGEPKYLNGPESPVFRKGEHLYGLHQGRESLRRERRALVVEGYLDVISLHARGFPTAVATLGTALTVEHIQALRRRVDGVVLLYDGDEAGRKAVFRSLDVFLPEGFPCRGILLPAEHDPDSFVREGHDLAALIDQAEPLLDLYLRETANRFDLSSVEGKLAAVEDLGPRLAAISDPLARDLYCRSVAEALGVDEAHLRARLRTMRIPRSEQKSGDLANPAEAIDPVERALLECLIYEPGQRADFLRAGVDAWMQPGLAREAARFVAQQSGGPDALHLEGVAPGVQTLLSEIIVREERPRNPYPLLENALGLRELKRRSSRIAEELRKAEAVGDDRKVMELMREQREIGRDTAMRKAASQKSSR